MGEIGFLRQIYLLLVILSDCKFLYSNTAGGRNTNKGKQNVIFIFFSMNNNYYFCSVVKKSVLIPRL